MKKNEEQKDLESVRKDVSEVKSGEVGEEGKTVSLGDYLKTRREARGITLKTISKDTKISLTKLESLEKDDFENLPNKIYIEGYVKSYAKSIGIESDKSLEILNLTYRKSPLRRRISLQEIPKENREKRVQASYAKMLFAVLGVVFILLVIVFFNYKKSSPSYSKSEEALPPVQLKSVDMEASFKMTPNNIVVKNTQVEDKVSEVSEKEGESGPDSPPERETAQVENSEGEKEERKDEKKIDFFPMKRSLYRIDTSVKPEALAKMIPDKVQRSLAANQQNIYIKAPRGDSWLSYKVDDEPIRNLTIKRDGDLLIRGKEVRIFFANIKVLDVFLNNRLLSIESSTGLKSMVFPQENRSKYVRPLFIYQDGKVETSEEYLSRIRQQGNENL